MRGGQRYVRSGPTTLNHYSLLLIIFCMSMSLRSQNLSAFQVQRVHRLLHRLGNHRQTEYCHLLAGRISSSSTTLLPQLFSFHGSISSSRNRATHRDYYSSSIAQSRQLTQSRHPQWKYNITHEFMPVQVREAMEKISLSMKDTNTNTFSQKSISILPRILMELNPKMFPSITQAKKSIRYCQILLYRIHPNEADPKFAIMHDEEKPINMNISISNSFRMNSDTNLSSSLVIGTLSTEMKATDTILVQSRLDDRFYPASITGHIYPPPFLRPAHMNSSSSNLNLKIDIIYEDDDIAIVHKPENLTTIGDTEKRDDLLSCLPFLLESPSFTAKQKYILPRPIHRLDRKTSGLLLVAKSTNAMKEYSSYFANRVIQKSYVALVLDIDGVTTSNCHGSKSDNESEEIAVRKGSKSTIEIYKDLQWNVIDYPIDGKRAITEWRVVATSTPLLSNSSNYTLSLLEINLKTGKFHQIRRHLSYCLGCPIVGDAKYDKGSIIAKSLRGDGMFLCSNAIQFPFSGEFNTEKDSLHNENIETIPKSAIGTNIFQSLDKCHIAIHENIEKNLGSHSKPAKTLNISIPVPKKFWKKMDIEL